MTLEYKGSGEHIPGVPARDLTDEDIQRIATGWDISEKDTIELLTKRGLYEKPKRSTSKTTKKTTTDTEDDD